MRAQGRELKTHGSVLLILFVWLIFSQMIVLASIYAWVEFRFYNDAIARIPGLSSQQNPYILLLCTYPVIPLVFSGLTWLGMLIRRYAFAIWCSLLAFVPAALLLVWIIVERVL